MSYYDLLAFENIFFCFSQYGIFYLFICWIGQRDLKNLDGILCSWFVLFCFAVSARYEMNRGDKLSNHFEKLFLSPWAWGLRLGAGQTQLSVGTGRNFRLRVGPGFFLPCTGRAGPARGPRIYGPKFRLQAKSRGETGFLIESKTSFFKKSYQLLQKLLKVLKISFN